MEFVYASICPIAKTPWSCLVNILKTAVVALCLCLGASVAFAQGDPPTDEQSGLDVFYPGMTVLDAQKQGAVKAEASRMNGKVVWNGVSWSAALLCKDAHVAVVGLTSKHIDQKKIVTFLQEMGERLAVPYVVTLESGGVKKQTDYAGYAGQGKDNDALMAIFQKEVQAFLQQRGDGLMSVVFCRDDMLKKIAEDTRTKGGVDEKALIKEFSAYPLYSLRLDKKNDGILVTSSQLSNMQH